jgi:hypothetical protein
MGVLKMEVVICHEILRMSAVVFSLFTVGAEQLKMTQTAS